MPPVHDGQVFFLRRSYKNSPRTPDENDLLNASQFGFRAHHNTTLQCASLTDHVTLNFNNNMSTVVVFLDTEKAFDTTWHPSLLYGLSKLQFSANLIELISTFLTNRNFRFAVESRLSTPHKIQAEVPQGFVLALSYITCI